MTDHTSVDELLIAHAAGKLPEPVGLAIATHLALCPAARARYLRYEAVGGLLLDELEPAPMAEDAWQRLAGCLDAEAGDALAPAARSDAAGSDPLPRPLRDYLPGPLETLRWRNLGAAAEIELRIRAPGYRATLMRVRAGRKVPQHTHEGSEFTVVLKGAFQDQTGHYARGDLAIADASVDHGPIADEDEDCLCLAVTDAPLRLTGRFGRFLNPFIRFWPPGDRSRQSARDKPAG
jgi:putative transcriptional regulator